MDITFNGHACVTLRSSDGLVVVTDPYRSGAFDGKLAHRPVIAPADVVTVSHYHVDHSHVTADLASSSGELPMIVDRARRVGSQAFTVRTTYHDRERGARMGLTAMVAFEMDGLRVAHLGDIGCDLTPADVAALGRVDVLLWPVGGTYTLGPEDAQRVLDTLTPRLAIPLHFEHERCRLGMQPVDALAPALRSTPLRPGRSDWSSVDGLKDAGAVVILEPAL